MACSTSHPESNRSTHKKSQRNDWCRLSFFNKSARLFLAVLLASGGNLGLVLPVLAITLAGTEIRNTATGSFEDPNNLGNIYQVNSNEVIVTVTEVTGITVVPSGIIEAPSSVAGAGANQGDGSIEGDDVVYFEYTITNVGNDPTQFFIPDAPSAISGGTFNGSIGPIEILSYDPDGASGPTAPTVLGTPVPVTSGGVTTGTAMGLPDGSIPQDGSITVRIPIKVDPLASSGDSVSVTLGDTGPNDNTAPTQNQEYDAIDGNNSGLDLYTQDNGDLDDPNESAGIPANGDPTDHRQEASAKSTILVGGNYAIGGNLFEDFGLGGSADGNDDQDVTETGVPGITVSLYQDTDNDGTGDVLVGSPATTDSLGNYVFTGLPDGNYVVVVYETDSDIGSLTYGGGDVDPTQINPRPVTVSGANVENVDFPFDAPTSSLTGLVWNDLDNDGLEEAGEGPVPNAQVNLYDTNGTPADPSDDILVGTTYTDASGTYVFNDLEPGKYYVDFSAPAVDYTFAVQDVGADDFIDSDADPLTGESDKFDIAAEENKVGVDAGLVLPPDTLVMCEVVSPLGMDWSQVVNLPKFDPALGDLTNVALQLDSHIATTVEYENEALSSNDITLTPNSTISATLPDGTSLSNTSHRNAVIYSVPVYDGTTDGSGSSGGTTVLNHVDSTSIATYGILSNFEASAAGAVETVPLTFDATGGTDSITSTQGSENILSTAREAQMSVCATYTYTSYGLSGNVFEDYGSGTTSNDGDDTLNGSEPGIGQISLELYKDDGDGIFDPATDSLVTTTVTDGSGDYSFPGLGNGDFWVRTDTTDGDLGLNIYGGGDAIASEKNPRLITINSADVTDINFPFDLAPAATGTAAMCDADGLDNALDLDDDNDGILDADEGGAFVQISPTDVGLGASVTGNSSSSDISAQFGLPTGSVILSWTSGNTNASGWTVSATESTLFTLTGTVPVEVQITHQGDLANSGDYDGVVSLDGTGYQLLSTLESGYYEDNIGNLYRVFADGSEDGSNDSNLTWASSTPVTSFEVKTTNTNSLDNDFAIAFAQMRDTDGDGIPDKCDLDSDNDGISDLVESGGDQTNLDPDNNGTIDGVTFTDGDNDGIADAIEATNGDNQGTPPAESTDDADTIPNFIDLDSDDDGIPDAIEAQLTADYDTNFPADTNVTNDDSDGDGIIDIYDSINVIGGNFNVPQDSDGDQIPDYLDLDSDNDTRPDNQEGGSTVTGVTYEDPNGNIDDPENDLPNQINDTIEVAYREAGDPRILLVKRITTINSDTSTDGGDNLSLYLDETNNPYDDNDITVADPVNPTDPQKDTNQWPNITTNLLGGINGGNVEPNDEIEYTIYFLSSGQSPVENVRFCDYIPGYTELIPDSFDGNPQISGGITGADLSVEVHRNGVSEYHTGANDGDAVVYFGPGIDPASDSRFDGTDCDDDGNDINANPNGAIVVDLGDILNASSATTVADESYGYIRFRARVK